MEIQDQEISFLDGRPALARTGQKSRPYYRLSAKHASFFVLGLMTLFVLYHNERLFIDSRSKLLEVFLSGPRQMIHDLGAATALILAALQFSTRLRHRRPEIHRLCGRCYVAGVLVAAAMAAYLSFTHGIRTMATETTVQSALWALTTVMALERLANATLLSTSNGRSEASVPQWFVT